MKKATNLLRNTILNRVPVSASKLDEGEFDAIGTHINTMAIAQHLLWMLDQIDEWFAAGENLDKANRWLGFVQGIVWYGYVGVTLNELRESVRK